ncbi:MAG: BamA/TamA family outer membrane protein [Ignavibacteriales bacterium]|nr:BamA/TamA family outer membrane protein [Ignavibacteriales bacterium]
MFDLSSTTGLQLGGGPIIINYDYRKKPWDSWLTLTMAYATRPRDFDFVFESYYNSILEDATVSFKAYRINIDFNNYYGYGNETDYNNHLYQQDFYNIKRRVTSGETGIDLHIGNGIRNYYQARISFYEVSVPEASLFKGLPYGSYGNGYLSVLTLGTGFIFDKRDNIDLPLEGWYLKFGGNYNPKLFNTNGSFYNATFDLRAYLPISFIKNSALAFRVGGEKVGGEYPFFAAAFLGGSKNLRAYRNERFSGDASLYGTQKSGLSLVLLKP